MYGLSTSIIIQAVSPNTTSFKSNTETPHRKMFPLPPAVPDFLQGPHIYRYWRTIYPQTNNLKLTNCSCKE